MIAGASLRLKLSAFIVALALLIVASVSTVLVAMRHREVHAELNRKARVYAELLGQQLEPAVAFDDQETAREVLNAASIDPDVRRAALYGNDGELIEGSDEVPPTWSVSPTRLELRATDRFVEVAVPVVSHEGPRGLLTLSLSTERAEHALQRDLMASLGVAAGSLLLSILAAWFIAGTVARRLQAHHRRRRSHRASGFCVRAARDGLA